MCINFIYIPGGIHPGGTLINANRCTTGSRTRYYSKYSQFARVSECVSDDKYRDLYPRSPDRSGLLPREQWVWPVGTAGSTQGGSNFLIFLLSSWYNIPTHEPGMQRLDKSHHAKNMSLLLLKTFFSLYELNGFFSSSVVSRH
jgi:hypothetical protein